MNYWIIDVSAGCPWGYSFCVKANIPEDCQLYKLAIISRVLLGSIKAGLFRNMDDWCGCAVHLIGYDAQVNLEDWADDAVEIEL